MSNYGTPNGHCYNYRTGQPWSCFDAGSQGGCLDSGGCYYGYGGYNFNLTPGVAPRRFSGREGGREVDGDRERRQRAG